MSQSLSRQLENVTRVIRLLDCFTHDQPELRLTDLSAATGMTKTQVLRIATTLEAGGYLRRDPKDKRFRLGLRVLELGAVARESLDLRRLARPHLERLLESTQETARLVVVDDHGPICADLVESPHGIRLHARLGERMPWNAGASGPVILAYLPEEKQRAILFARPLPKYNEATELNPNNMVEELEMIRKQGYFANDTGDLVEGARGVAAPVFDGEGTIVGAIGLGAPSSRWTPANVRNYIDLVTSAARQLSRELGYQALPPS